MGKQAGSHCPGVAIQDSAEHFLLLLSSIWHSIRIQFIPQRAWVAGKRTSQSASPPESHLYVLSKLLMDSLSFLGFSPLHCGMAGFQEGRWFIKATVHAM